MPGDMAVKPKEAAFHGQTDVYITRAELELKKAMQSLVFMTSSEINSVSTLTALSLPRAVAPLLWTIRALLQEQYQKTNDDHQIHHRNQDARLLYQQLAKLDLLPWSDHSVHYVSPDALPNNLLFPVGHPVRGRTYRRHPFKSRQNQYYPVTDYFSMLFKEREQALVALLAELGATKITMTPILKPATLEGPASLVTSRQQVFTYAPKTHPLPPQLDLRKHPWLAGEPTWQAVVRERLERGVLATQFEFDRDVMGMLSAQIRIVGQFVVGLVSMSLPDDYEETIRVQVLKTRQVQVEFCEMPVAEMLHSY